MGVRPGTVDGRVPQQTPRRTPRTLSESAARDTRDDPSRNEVGPERYAPPSTRHRPTTPWRALSPGDAHDAPTSALADTPRPLPGKFPSLVPLPTIPLPNVDSPFPRLPNHAWPMPLPLFCTPPTAHPRDGVSLRLDARRRPPQPRGAQTVRLDLDAALRAQPFSALTPGSEFRPTELLAPLLSAHPSGRVFRSASRRGRVPASRDLDSDRLADVRANLARGNHKSARGHEAKLISMLKDEAQGVGSYHCREKPP
ncbi:hypothetical protein MHU86_14411 [Fragilaria crotonensis]|nr:hypothetical protein MHU86_14411 [Fragilaria crotonensis]